MSAFRVGSHTPFVSPFSFSVRLQRISVAADAVCWYDIAPSDQGENNFLHHNLSDSAVSFYFACLCNHVTLLMR